MNPAFQFDTYALKRQFLALTGKLRLYNSNNNLVLYVEQKFMRLKEDIRVFDSELKTREVLIIKARTIIDFSATYDVIDPAEGIKVGALRRKGVKSLFRDQWEVLDESDRPIGLLFEDSMLSAILRRLIIGALLPQDYDIKLGELKVADFKQRFNFFVYNMDLNFSMDINKKLDRRIGIAAAILLAVLEGKQES